jgi:hypothetical protein
MKSMHLSYAGTEVSGNNNYNNNEADNDVTRAIDAQIVIAPQYGIPGPLPCVDPPKSPNNGKRRATHRRKKQPRYQVRKERTRDLKLYMAFLRAELALVAIGKLHVNGAIRAAMQERLTIMSDEMVRRDLQDLAGGKLRSGGAFLSLGARARVA